MSEQDTPKDYIDIEPEIRVTRIYRDGSWREVVRGTVRRASFPEAEADLFYPAGFIDALTRGIATPEMVNAWMQHRSSSRWSRLHCTPPSSLPHRETPRRMWSRQRVYTSYPVIHA